VVDRTISQQLKKYLSIFPVVSVFGARQTGKTTLAKSMLADLDLSSGGVYLNMADERDLARVKDPTTFLEYYRDQLVVIDEIRYHTELFPIIRLLIDRHNTPGRFLILGLSNPLISSKGYEELKRRTGFLTINPLDWLEVNTDASLATHWLKGGFSESLFAVDDESGFEWLREYIRNYMERDLPMLGLKANSQLIHNFMKMIAGCQGEIWNARIFGRALGITSPTVKRYLDHLENAFLVNVLKSFNPDAGKRLVKSPKVYVSDTGILHCLLGLNDVASLRQHDLFAMSWESYVIAQVQSVVTKKIELYYYCTHQGACADLVLVKNGIPAISLLISITNEPVIPKGFNISINDLKTDQNFIVCPNPQRYHLTSNIEIIGITDLLLMLKMESI